MRDVRRGKQPLLLLLEMLEEFGEDSFACVLACVGMSH